MHLLNGSSTSKDITINLDNYDKVNEGNLEEQYLNKCRIYVLTGYRKNLDEAQEVKSFLNEKMDEMINKPSVQLDLVTAELSKLRNNLKKWNGTDDVATIADGIDLKSAVSTAMLVNKVADKLLGKNSRIPTSVGNNPTVELLDSANTQGGGGQPEDTKKLRKPRNQSNQLVVDSNAISNLSEQRIFKDSASNSPSSQNINLDNLKELCIKPFADYKQSKIDQGRWETNVDQGKKDILENVKEGISKATSIEQIKDAIDTVISSAQTKPSSVLGGIFQTVKNTFASPGELHTAAQEAKKIFDEQKDKVQSSENAFSNKQGTI